MPKIIDQIKKIQKNVFLVGFKAETNLSGTKLISSARKKLRESNADIIIANDIGIRYKENPEYNNVIIVDLKKVIQSGWKKKLDVARFIRKDIERRLDTD